MAEDKKIKISAQVDDAGFKKALDYLKEINKEIREIAKNSSAGLLGGGGGFGGVSAQQQQPGMPSPVGTTVRTSPLSSGILGDAQAIAKQARSSIGSIRELSESVKRGTIGQIQDIEKLTGTIKKLEEGWARLSVAKGAAMDSGQTRMAGQLDSQMAGNELSQRTLSAQRAAHLAARGVAGEFGGMVGPGQRVVNRGGIDYVVNEGEEPNIPGQQSSRSSRMGRALFGKNGFGAAASERVGWTGTESLGLVGTASAVAGAAMAGYSLATMAMNVPSEISRDSTATGLRYETQLPLRGLKSAGRVGAVFGGWEASLLQGDAGKGAAIEETLNNPRVREYFAKQNQDNILKLIALETHQDQSFASTREQDLESGKVRMANLATGTESNARLQQEYDKMQREFMLRAENAEMLGGAVQSTESSDPLRFAMIRQAHANAPGFAAMLRQSGIGGQGGRMVDASRLEGLTWDKNIPVSESRVALANKTANFMARYGYTAEQGFAAESEYGAMAGRGVRGRGAYLNTLREGGLTNAFQLGAAGEAYGGGGSGFIDMIQRGIGGRGADVTAGGQIAGIIAQQMMSGGYRGTGGGAVPELLGWASGQGTGIDTGSSMRMANTIAKGYGAAGDALGGKYSQLQEGLYWASANRNMGGNVYGANELASMSWGERLDLETGKGDQHWNKLFGLGPELAKNMRASSAKGMFSEFHGSLAQGMDEDVVSAARSIAGGGDIGGEFGKLKDKYKAGGDKKSVEHALQTLSAGLTSGTQAERMASVIALLGPQGFKEDGTGAGAGMDKQTREILKKKGEEAAKAVIAEGQGAAGAASSELVALGTAVRSSATDFQTLAKAMGGLLKALGVARAPAGGAPTTVPMGTLPTK